MVFIENICLVVFVKPQIQNMYAKHPSLSVKRIESNRNFITKKRQNTVNTHH